MNWQVNCCGITNKCGLDVILQKKKMALSKKIEKQRGKAPYYRLASRYLVFSLIVALLPIIILSALYDNYFSDLVSKISDHQNAVKVVAYENATNHFLIERELELGDLLDQFDHPKFFEEQLDQPLSLPLETILRVLVDTPHTYGVVFFGEDGQVVRSFPSKIIFNLSNEGVPYSKVGDLEVFGPSKPSFDLPGWVILKRSSNESKNKDLRSKKGIGFVIRFATLTEFMHNLTMSGFRKPILETPDGFFYDAVGLIQKDQKEHDFQLLSEVIPGWKLFLSKAAIKAVSPTIQVRYLLLLTALLTALVIIYLHYDISYRLNHQIDRLVKRVERVARGDIDTPLKVAGSWEISRLSVAIESMRTQLKKFIRSNLEMERRASLGQMAAGVAHEVRNPLTIINTAVSALAKSEKDPERLELMEIVKDEIDRSNMVLSDLLDYARPREPEPIYVKVSELFESIKVSISVTAKQQNVGVISDIRKPEHGDLFVWGDPVHLRQILMNLVLNGLQSMEQKEAGQLTLRAFCENEKCNILIEDQGCGISNEELTHMSEPFFTTKPSGVGLGLAICSSLISTNGGRLSFESKLGEGTITSVILPNKPFQE